MSTNNAQNLIPFNKRTENEQREITKNGGIASGRKRREKKAAAEYMKQLLYLPLGEFSAKEKAMLKNLGVKQAKDHTQLCLMLVSVLRKALKGDINAVKMALMLIGQMPAEKQEVTGANGTPFNQPIYDLSGIPKEQLMELTREAFKRENEISRDEV